MAYVAPRLLVVHGARPLLRSWDALTRERAVARQCRRCTRVARPAAGTVASDTRAGHRRGAAIGTANTMAFPGAAVRCRHRMGQCGAHEERRRDRLRTLP